MALVVRDEERFLDAHLKYHRLLGVERCYVFLDQCQDASPAVVARHRHAVALERHRREDELHMSAFQTRCLREALALARADGFDWLAHVDPDEFAWGDNRSAPCRLLGLGRRPADRRLLERGSLARMLAGMPARAEQVVLRTKEAMPVAGRDGEPFWELTHFQDRRIVPRQLLDPRSGEVRTLRHWLGGWKGKAIVRVAADVEPESAHRWRGRGGRALRTRRHGWYYHYLITDWRHWADKYRKFSVFPDRWQKGAPVRFPKQAWKEAAARMSDGEARAYFDAWVGASHEDLRRWRRQGRLTCERHVARVLARAGSEPPQA